MVGCRWAAGGPAVCRAPSGANQACRGPRRLARAPTSHWQRILRATSATKMAMPARRKPLIQSLALSGADR